MANPIEYTNINPTTYVTVSSRYVNSRVIYYGQLRRITFTTYKKHDIPEAPTDRFAVIPAGMEYRPDRMSQEYYGTPDFWWKILEANGITDIFDFKTGKTVRLPSNIF